MPLPARRSPARAGAPRHGHHTAGLVPCSRGEGITPDAASRWAKAWPQLNRKGVWAPRPSRSSAAAGQQRGGHNAAPLLVKPVGPTRGRHDQHAARLVQGSGGEGMKPSPAGRSPAWAGAPRVWAPRPARCSADAKQRRGGHDAAPRWERPSLGQVPACASAWAHCHRAARLVPGSAGEGVKPSPPGKAWLRPGPTSGRHSQHADRLVPCSGGEGIMSLPTGRSPARAGAPRVCHCVDATACALLGCCRAAQGKACCSSPPDEARLGQGPHVRGRSGQHAALLAPGSGGEGVMPLPADTSLLGPGPHVFGRHGQHAARLAQGSRGEGLMPPSDAAPCHAKPGLGWGPTCVGRRSRHAAQLMLGSVGEGLMPLPAGQSPARRRAGDPRARVPLPSGCSAGAVQRRGGHDAVPSRAKPGFGRGPTCVGATAIITLLGRCQAAWGRA